MHARMPSAVFFLFFLDCRYLFLKEHGRQTALPLNPEDPRTGQQGASHSPADEPAGQLSKPQSPVDILEQAEQQSNRTILA